MSVLELGYVINGVRGRIITERRMCKEQYLNHVLAGTECEENPGEVRRTGPKFLTGGPEYETITIQSRGSTIHGFWNFVSEKERSFRVTSSQPPAVVPRESGTDTSSMTFGHGAAIGTITYGMKNKTKTPWL